ncbi:MAG: hypothetical protein IJ446_09385 [Oscillospiraceae bacterium]|nr:hypothetical protein [Oscillospiraceae bacterium]
MPFSIISPAYYNELTDETNPLNEGVSYTVTVTPYSVEYSFPLMQERVVRKLMEIKEPISFNQQGIDEEKGKVYIEKAKDLVSKFPQLIHYWPGKSVMMNAIQDRQYSIEKRMLLINYVFKAVDNMNNNGKEKEIPPFIMDFMAHPDRSAIMEYFSSLNPNFEFSVLDALSMMAGMPDTKNFKEVRQTVFDRLGYKTDLSNVKDHPFSDVKDKYFDMKINFFSDYLGQGKDKDENREYLLENVLVGFIWSLNMPFSDYSLSMWDNFAFFNVIFNTLKVLLTVYVTKENGDEDFVKAVTAFDESIRAIKGGMVQTTVDMLNKRGFNTNGDMAILSLS